MNNKTSMTIGTARMILLTATAIQGTAFTLLTIMGFSQISSSAGSDPVIWFIYAAIAFFGWMFSWALFAVSDHVSNSDDIQHRGDGKTVLLDVRQDF